MTPIPLSRSGKEAIDVAVEAVRQAGGILKAHFREERQVRYKGRANIVTDLDLLAEKSLITLLQDEYPDHGILSEESEPIPGNSDYTWVLDPLDGTNNYSFGIPFFSTVISPVKVSGKTKVRDSLIGLDVGYVDDNGKRLLRFIAELWPDMYAYRIMGSAALGMAYTACGRLDAYFHLLVYPWELACGRLLVMEAGGVITDWEGRPVGTGESSIIAASEPVNADFVRLMRELGI
jgi:myo-inositol-1(or 4)-monophosphatase